MTSKVQVAVAVWFSKLAFFADSPKNVVSELESTPLVFTSFSCVKRHNTNRYVENHQEQNYEIELNQKVTEQTQHNV